VTILSGVEAEVEVRCPVDQEHPDGTCHPGKLFLKLRLSGIHPTFVHPQNLIELSCSDCKRRLARQGVHVHRVLHRYDLSGSLIETLTEGGSSL
jgi:hypothetical protein